MGDDRLGNMYLHEDGVNKSTVVIRFSDEPGDYWSSPVGLATKGAIEVDNQFYEKWLATQEDTGT